MIEKIKKYKIVLLLSLVSLGVCLSLFRPGYFSMHDDIQVMRLFQIEKCFLDGQIPCRWVPDMGAGYGYPLFNFYGPFPYYLGMVFRLLGFSFIHSVKILFGFSFFLSGLFMYLLAKEFFNKWGGFLAGVFYLYAPYHAVDVYVRGAMAESWAITLFPLIFWSIYRFVKEEKPLYFLTSILSLFALIITHNIMTLLFSPVLIVWAIFCLFSLKKLHLSLKVMLAILGAFGLGAFFWVPSYFEKSLVNISWLTSEYFDFQKHFVSLKQLFWRRSFGYGPSVWGDGDQLSFQLGLIHWLTIVTAAFYSFRKRHLVSFFCLVFWIGAIFMTHAKSLYIWQMFPLLSFVQFPWRFLGLAIFAGAFLAGSLAKNKLLVLGLTFLVIVFNFSYFRPEKFVLENDAVILSGANWQGQSMGAILDYLPKGISRIPTELAPDNPWTVTGMAEVTEYAKRSNFWRFTVDAREDSLIAVPVFDFPFWQVLVDQVPISHNVSKETGVIEVPVPKGKHTVVGWFKNTPIRNYSEAFSLLSLTSIFLYLGLQKNHNEKAN